MQPLGKSKAHYWLVKRMAKSAQVDLVAATARGDLDQKGWAKMVQRCRGCADPAHCARWLDRQQGSGAVPQGCANRARFASLRQTQQQEG